MSSLPPTDDLFFSVLSPPGQGAIGVIHLEGPGAAEVLRSVGVLRSGSAPRTRRAASGGPFSALRLGRIVGETGPIDEVIAERKGNTDRSPSAGRDVPASFSVNCHGGAAAVRETCLLLERQGVRPGEPFEIPLRRFVAGQIDAVQLEASLILPESPSRAAARLVLESVLFLREGVRGDVSREWVKEAMEAFPALASLLRTHRVCVLGPENCGKSTLINAITRRTVSVTSPLPGTTRDSVSTAVTWRGLLIELRDTAGLGVKERDELKQAALEEASKVVGDSGVVVLVSSPDTVPLDAGAAKGKRIVKVWNKADLEGESADDDLEVSALKGEGIGQLLDALAEHLLPSAARPGAFTGRQVRVLEAVLRGEGRPLASLLYCSPEEVLNGL